MSSPAAHPKPNAKRRLWPVIFPNANGQFEPAYIEYSRDLAVCESLVRMGAGILGRPLKLIAGGPKDGIYRGATDGTNIWLPKMHPRRRVVVKHELSHLFFKSDLALRAAFVSLIVDELEKGAGTKLAVQARDGLIQRISFFTNILDDVRVNSLWGLLYPGDGEDLDEWYFETVGPDMMEKAQKQYKGGDIDDLFTYAILLCLRQDAQSTKWGEFRDDIVQAREAVIFKAFPASLAITRDLVLKIARKLFENLHTKPAWGGPPDPGAADPDHDAILKQRLEGQAGKKQALLILISGTPPDPTFVDHNGSFDIQKVDGTPAAPETDGKSIEAAKQLKRLLVEGEDLPEFLEQQESAGMNLVQQIQRTQNDLPILGNYKSSDDLMRKALRVDLRVTRIAKSTLLRTLLDPSDRAEIQRWRSRFQRIHGASRHRLEEVGHDFCADVYIQQRLNREPPEAYYREVSGRGFDATLLIDLSGSMEAKFREVVRLSAGLRLALDYPFVRLSEIGFKQTEDGQVDLVLYPPKPPGLRSTLPLVGGLTPLSHAVTAAAQLMRGRQNDRSIFLLSDGKPVFQLKGKTGSLPERTLMTWTKTAVEDVRKQHIKVFVFMIGDYAPSDGEMNFMFGPRNWRKIPEDRLFPTAFEFLTDEFLRFAKTR